MSSTESWYVYYKVEAAEAGAVAARVRNMLASVATATGIEGRLLRRQEPPQAEVTLLEVYDRVRDGARLAAALADALDASGLSPALRDGRRLERFGDLSRPCA